jgi:hypothetical protein
LPETGCGRLPAKRIPMDGKICGHVVDTTERVVAEATVFIVASPDIAPDIAALSDATGHFVFDGLGPGVYRLRALGSTGEFGETDATVPAAGTTAIVIRLGSISPS